MSLDLTKTATQIDGMAVDLKARQNERQQRLHRALEAIQSFAVDDYERMREEMGDSRNGALPAVPDAPDSRLAPRAPAARLLRGGRRRLTHRRRQAPARAVLPDQHRRIGPDPMALTHTPTCSAGLGCTPVTTSW